MSIPSHGAFPFPCAGSTNVRRRRAKGPARRGGRVSLLLVVLLAVLPAAIWLIQWTLGSGLPPRPLLRGANVLVITVDTLRQDRVGTYGRIERRLTPNLDRLAEESVRFTNAFSVSSFTPPSHASLFTGLYPSTHGLTDWDHVLPEVVTSLAEAFLEHRITTHAFINLPTLSQMALDQGFWTVKDYPRERVARIPKEQLAARVHEIFATAGETVDAILASLDTRRPGEETFDWIHLYDVHRPYARSGDWKNHFGASSRPEIGDREIHYNLTPEQIARQGLTEGDLRHIADRYDAGILPVDEALGRLFRELRRRGLWDRTLIVLTADHGEALLERREERVFTHDPFLYDEVIRVPLLMKWPRGTIPPGTSEDLVSLVDVMPTILEAEAIPLPAATEGVSLLPRLLGSAGPPRSTVLAEVNTPKWADQLAIRNLRWKLVLDRRRGTCALFDLREDPGEHRPLRCEDSQAGTTLRRLLETWAERDLAGSHESFRGLSEDERQRLESLGY